MQGKQHIFTVQFFPVDPDFSTRSAQVTAPPSAVVRFFTAWNEKQVKSAICPHIIPFADATNACAASAITTTLPSARCRSLAGRNNAFFSSVICKDRVIKAVREPRKIHADDRFCPFRHCRRRLFRIHLERVPEAYRQVPALRRYDRYSCMLAV